MFVSQINLNLNNVNTIKLLADRQRMHVFVQSMFGSDRQSNNIQYDCVANSSILKLIVRSDIEPVLKEADKVFAKIISVKSTDTYFNSFKCNQYLRFHIVIAPLKRNKETQKHVTLKTPEERETFLKKKFADSGLAVAQYVEKAKEKIAFKKGTEAFYSPYEYTGIVQVTDKEKLLNALHSGIGKGKSYGLGMLSVIPTSV